MDIKDFDWVDAFRLWWAFIWRAALWGVAINFVVMFLLGFFMGTNDLNQALDVAVLPLVVLNIFIQIWQFKIIIPSQLKRFSINNKGDGLT